MRYCVSVHNYISVHNENNRVHKSKPAVRDTTREHQRRYTPNPKQATTRVHNSDQTKRRTYDNRQNLISHCDKLLSRQAERTASTLKQIIERHAIQYLADLTINQTTPKNHDLKSSEIWRRWNLPLYLLLRNYV